MSNEDLKWVEENTQEEVLDTTSENVNQEEISNEEKSENVNQEEFSNEEPEEELITTPKFFKNSEETSEEEPQEEENIEELDNILDDLLNISEEPSEEEPQEEENSEEEPQEEENSEEEPQEELWKNGEELELAQQELEEMQKELEKTKEDEQKIAQALDKLGEHPILWPLNEKLLKGEDVDIPSYLKNIVEKEIETLPKMEEAISEPTWTEKEESLGQLIAQQNKAQNDFWKNF